MQSNVRGRGGSTARARNSSSLAAVRWNELGEGLHVKGRARKSANKKKQCSKKIHNYYGCVYIDYCEDSR